MDADALFRDLGGTPVDGLPCLHSPVHHTDAGTAYLPHAGVVMIARPQTSIRGMQGFLEAFDPSLGFESYVDDPTELSAAAQLLKTAGQTCYASFGPGRSRNEHAQRYFDNLASSGHGSVFEHAVFSFFLYGISRSNTHEVVRHRAGVAVSQLSQRYVSGSVLRFVERAEYRDVPSLHKRFEQRIDAAAREYAEVTDELAELQAEGSTIMSAEGRRDLRKKVQSSARSVLPNETETTMMLSANVRAWRHMIEMRTEPHAETEIRDLFFRIFLCLRVAEPMLFGDYAIVRHTDGTYGARTDWRKV